MDHPVRSEEWISVNVVHHFLTPGPVSGSRIKMVSLEQFSIGPHLDSPRNHRLSRVTDDAIQKTLR